MGTEPDRQVGARQGLLLPGRRRVAGCRRGLDRVRPVFSKLSLALGWGQG